MAKPVLVGAVVYDPKVATIWEIIKDFFRAEGFPIDYVFYSNYELQVEALLAGHIHVAWNSPLAWVDLLRRSGGGGGDPRAPRTPRAIAMRDTDRDRVTHLLVRRDGGVRALADLRGKTVATGALDSPQATLLPLHLLDTQGLTPHRDFTVRRFDVLVGKHGDHVGGELEALRCLQRGEADACAVLDLNWERWQADGTADPSTLVSLAATPRFDHCNFSVLGSFPADLEAGWKETLFRMRYDDPAHREMMDMEGLKQWLDGRTTGYAALTEATRRQRFFAGRDGG